MNNRNWMADAACKTVHTSVFFPTRGQNAEVEQAKAVCSECAVRETCLEYALDLSTRVEVIGIWGGMSAKQREQILYKRNLVVRHNAFDVSVLE